MSGLGSVLAAWSEKWLAGFLGRHGLDSPAVPKISTDESVLLHVACGNASIAHIHLPGFHDTPWRELRLDADASVNPDIVGTMTDMSAVSDNFVDALFSSHGIEHLYWHDVPRALLEFYRVLKPDGFVVITCPDVQAAAQMIAEDRMFETAYESAAGPITPFDILYSYRPFVEANPQWMSHHCGFTLSTLIAALTGAGFPAVYGIRRPSGFDLWVMAFKGPRSREELEAMAAKFVPPGS